LEVPHRRATRKGEVGQRTPGRISTTEKRAKQGGVFGDHVWVKEEGTAMGSRGGFPTEAEAQTIVFT